jgi:hypothetical protein
MTKMRVTGFEATRRKILKGALAGAAFLGLGVNAAQAAKASQGSVAYRGSPKGDQNCANCSLFISPNDCKSVVGPVSANGWCRIWRG